MIPANFEGAGRTCHNHVPHASLVLTVTVHSRRKLCTTSNQHFLLELLTTEVIICIVILL